jgi:hypothetical protein
MWAKGAIIAVVKAMPGHGAVPNAGCALRVRAGWRSIADRGIGCAALASTRPSW